jgi:hypothetical protein
MPASRQLPPHLLDIKSHIDSHGFGCAIVDDHVAIGVCENCGEDGRVKEAIKRVKSFGESCEALGCACGRPANES